MLVYTLILAFLVWRGSAFNLPISPLRLIVSGEAFVSSVANNLYREIPENFIINSLFKTRYHMELDILYVSIIILSIYSRYQEVSDPSSERWNKIPMYLKTQKRTNRFIIVLMIVFTKNIENAI